VEERYLELLNAVRRSVTIPVAVKLSPFFSSLPNMARQLAAAGARSLVLFNRFYQPDIDPEQLSVTPNLVLSKSDELRLALRWVAILHGRVDVDLAVTGGVHTHIDVIKSLMAGASVAMTTSELLQNGVGRIQAIVHDLREWLEQHEYTSVRQMIGSMSQRNVVYPQAYTRANYLNVLDSWRASGDPPVESRVAQDAVYEGDS
jgi:dihydroorotate dehydrogenase (fumarate)